MEDKNIITLTLGDWLYNSGIVGIVNILKYAEEEVNYEGQSVSFDVKALENFEKKYFKYFIDKYEKKLSWSKIVSFKEKIDFWKNENFNNFNEKSLKDLNYNIGNFKKIVKSNSHISAYELITKKIKISEIEKELQKIKLKKSEKVENKIKEIKKIISLMVEIIDFYSEEESKKYLGAKNVMYTILKNAWNGVSFLNSQTKEKDMYIDYKNYFLKESLKYLDTDKKKYKYDCRVCNKPIKNLDIEMNFLNNMGFDTTRKPSAVWNYNNDISICPLCKLVYSCVPAGFNYVYDKGIFVNDNNNSKDIVRLANKIGFDILKEKNFDSNITFKSLVSALTEELNNSLKYNLSDIQVVRYENEKYRFNILSKNILKVINESKEELNKIIKANYKEGDFSSRLYEIVIKKIFNNENLFLIIHKLFVIKLKNSMKEVYFSYKDIKEVVKINFNFLKGVGYMEDKEKDVLKTYSGAGYYLREEYIKKNSENKLSRITYKLLNALKTNNQGMFMDVIINCYLYTGKQVPSFFVNCLKDNINLKTIGYSFVSGLVDGESYKK